MMRSSVLVLVAVVQLLVFCNAADDRKHCYDDMAACAQTLKDLLVDNQPFWFGEDYTTKCPKGPVNLNCLNPRPNRHTVVSRLYNTTEDLMDRLPNDLQVTKVTYNSPKGSYHGCGHTFEEPEVKDYHVDPASVISIGQFAIDQTPTIQWDVSKESSGQYYTVMIWDSGYFWNHALYVNAQGGSIVGSTAINPYFGPKNPLLKPNVYIAAVFKQSKFIESEDALKAFKEVWTGSNLGKISATVFNDKVETNNELFAANILTVPGDALGLQYQKDHYIVNHCPSLITGEPVFKMLMDAAGVEAAWKEESSALHNKPFPYISTLTLDLKAEYHMEKDVMVDSCCVKHTYTKSMFVTDPIGDATTRPVVVSHKPRMHITPIAIVLEAAGSVNFRASVYTLMMVDLTEYLRVGGDKTHHFFIHWMVTDIMGGDVNMGMEKMSYVGPVPYKSNHPQAYVFLMFEQNENSLDTSNLKDFISDNCPHKMEGRCGSDFSGLLRELDLGTIVGVTWFTAEQDAYTRKNLYGYPGSMEMSNVCLGQKGFQEPCPKHQYCEPNSGSTQGYALTHILFTAIIAFITKNVL